MKKLKVSLVILAASFPMTGCSIWTLKHGRDKPQFSYVMPNQNERSLGNIYLWNPSTTVAYIANDGKACIFPADVFRFRTTEVNAGAKVSAWEGIEGLDASTKARVAEQVARLSSKDAAGTYLGVALFNICMVANNQDLSSAQVIHLVDSALESASELAIAGDPVQPPAGGPTP